MGAVCSKGFLDDVIADMHVGYPSGQTHYIEWQRVDIHAQAVAHTMIWKVCEVFAFPPPAPSLKPACDLLASRATVSSINA